MINKLRKNLNNPLNNPSLFNFELKYEKNELIKKINEYKSKLIDHSKLNLLQGPEIILWINLDRSEERRLNMKCILERISIPNLRIKATDGLIFNKKDYFIFEDRDNVSNKEYACLHSHLESIKYLHENNINLGLILEDDISIEFINFWDKSLEQVINNAPKDWEILMLGYINLNDIKSEYEKRGITSSAMSYLINKKGISKIMKIYKENKWILKNGNYLADCYIYDLVNTYVYKYPFFTYNDNNPSTINNSDKMFWLHKCSKLKTYDVWFNSKK